jgi:hypothetical protein
LHQAIADNGSTQSVSLAVEPHPAITGDRHPQSLAVPRFKVHITIPLDRNPGRAVHRPHRNPAVTGDGDIKIPANRPKRGLPISRN